MDTIKRFFIEDEGAEVGEWALFFALLAVIAIGATMALDPAVSNAFDNLGQSLEDASNKVVIP